MKQHLFVFIIISILTIKTEAQTSVLKLSDDLLLNGKYQEALVVLEKGAPKTFEIYDKTASIYQTVSNYNKAIYFYKKALGIKEVEVVKSKLGKIYNLAGFPSKAIKIYEEVFEKDSANLLVANSLGKLYLSNRKSGKAVKIYRYLKRKDTLNPNYPYQLGQALAKRNEHFKMADNYLDAFAIDSLHLKSIYGLANFFKKIRDKDSTQLFINKGLKIDKNNLNFNQLKATVLYTDKKYGEAIKHLELLDSLNYKTVGTYDLFGMSYMKLDSLELAEKHFKKALEVDRMSSVIHYRLGSLYYRKKENVKAQMSLMMSIMAGKPDLDKQYYLSGIIAKEDTKLKVALKFFQKAVENNSNNHKALFELAITSDAYYKDKKIAYNHYERFVNKYENRDAEMTAFSQNRMKEIKTKLFEVGIKVE